MLPRISCCEALGWLSTWHDCRCWRAQRTTRCARSSTRSRAVTCLPHEQARLLHTLSAARDCCRQPAGPMLTRPHTTAAAQHCVCLCARSSRIPARLVRMRCRAKHGTPMCCTLQLQPHSHLARPAQAGLTPWAALACWQAVRRGAAGAAPSGNQHHPLGLVRQQSHHSCQGTRERSAQWRPWDLR
jgi:hypothetical protein